MSARDALSPQYLEISQEFPDFPDFELRGQERSQKSGISWCLCGKSSECTRIALQWGKRTFFISIFVKVACLHYSVSRKAGPSSGVPIYWKVYKLIFNHAIYPNYNVRIPGKMTFVVFTRMAFHRAFHFSKRAVHELRSGVTRVGGWWTLYFLVATPALHNFLPLPKTDNARNAWSVHVFMFDIMKGVHMCAGV